MTEEEDKLAWARLVSEVDWILQSFFGLATYLSSTEARPPTGLGYHVFYAKGLPCVTQVSAGVT